MILKFKNQRIINAGTPISSTTAQMDATDTTIAVLSDDRFASATDKYVLFGNFGDENSELVAFTSATGNVLTVGAVTKDHPTGTPAYLLNANQVEFFYCATVDGTYASLSKVAIDPESLVTTYEDAAHTTGFGKAIFYNAAAVETYQTYWEIIKYDNDTRATRGFVKRVSMDRQNIPDGDPDVTEDFLNDAVTECDQRIKDEKINWKEEFAELTVETVVGQTKYDISSYFKEQLTISSILYAKCDGVEVPATTFDNFLANLLGAVTTTLAADIALVDVTVTVTDSSDLPDEGSIMVGSDSIDYTANDRATNILSGVTEITAVHSSGDEVWYNQSTGSPTVVSVMNGYLYTYPFINADADAKTITILYSKEYTNITLDSDELGFPSFLYISFLKSAIAAKKGQKDAQTLERNFNIDIMKHKAKDVSPTETGFKPGMVIYPSSRRGSLR